MLCLGAFLTGQPDGKMSMKGRTFTWAGRIMQGKEMRGDMCHNLLMGFMEGSGFSASEIACVRDNRMS
jgi:hypothetical protein